MLDARISRLLLAGGFPEAYLNPKEAARLRNDRMELVTRDDLRDLSLVSSWRGPADLVELLRERVGKPVNYDNLAQSLSISPPTAKSWVELLEKLYIIFLLPPYSNRLSRSIRKDRRIYFFDCAAAYDETGGAQLENLVASSLLNQNLATGQMVRRIAIRHEHRVRGNAASGPEAMRHLS
jgi:predicted AAA+ superfamily ATPase